MRIVITNATMANGGDAAITFSIVEMLKATFGSNTDISIIDSLGSGIACRYPSLTIYQMIGRPAKGRKGPTARIWKRLSQYAYWRMRLFLLLLHHGVDASSLLLTARERRVIRAYAGADLLISTGGTYLVDHYNLSPRLLELEIIRHLGQKPIFYTQSLGPFHRAGLREAVKPHFDSSPLILLRDQRSKEHLESLRIDPRKLHVLADSVFGLADPEILKAAAVANPAMRRVAISVRDWRRFPGQDARMAIEKYLAGIARTTERLVALLDCDVTFISTCQGIAEYHANDSLVADQVVSRVSDSRIVQRIRVDHGFHDPRLLLTTIGHYDLVIATRMHMAILALSAGVPVVPIAYEFKTSELFERLGMGHWVTAIGDVDEVAFPFKVQCFVEALPTFRSRLFQAVERERVLALNAAPLLKTAAEGLKRQWSVTRRRRAHA